MVRIGAPAAAFAHTAGGVAAIGVKELRGRMRGRRAFIVVTLFLFLLGAFALMVEPQAASRVGGRTGMSAAFASAQIGQVVFAALLMLMTLQVVFLAPSSTAGTLSLEREKQTLDMLIATPISSLAIIVGKLLSALAWVFLLVAASVPMLAVVFVFGGVGPESVLPGYLVLLAVALGLGSFGLLCSTLLKRTIAATAVTIFGVLAVTIGTAFILVFWNDLSGFDENGNRTGHFGIRTPVILAYMNPFIAQADVMCTTENTFGGEWCELTNGFVPTSGIVFVDGGGSEPMPPPGAPQVDPAVDPNSGKPEPGVSGGDDGVANQVVPFGQEREWLWPRSVATWLILSVIFTLISVQAVSPTRRWRLRRGPAVTGSADA